MACATDWIGLDTNAICGPARGTVVSSEPRHAARHSIARLRHVRTRTVAWGDKAPSMISLCASHVLCCGVVLCARCGAALRAVRPVALPTERRMSKHASASGEAYTTVPPRTCADDPGARTWSQWKGQQGHGGRSTNAKGADKARAARSPDCWSSLLCYDIPSFANSSRAVAATLFPLTAGPA